MGFRSGRVGLGMPWMPERRTLAMDTTWCFTSSHINWISKMAEPMALHCWVLMNLGTGGKTGTKLWARVLKAEFE